MSDVLERLTRAGVLSPLDRHFAEAMARLGGDEPAGPVLLAIALASRQVEQGHVCLDLGEPPPVSGPGGEWVADVTWPEPVAWREVLAGSALVSDPEGEGTPLVLDGEGRLYLRRFWEHQRELAAALRERSAVALEPRDPAWLRASLLRLFPGEADVEQRVAALTAMTRRLAVVTGGPGTGKTSTVVKILALLAGESERSGGPLPRVRLLAPTGKAAGRLSESIRSALAALELGDVVSRRMLDEIVPEASTIHRALGPLGAGALRFRHDRGNRLLVDLVLVDECSMVDLPLMGRLLAAIPDPARLVLLGDRDQLASVEAGAVLGDLCDRDALERPVSAERAGLARALAGWSGDDAGSAAPALRDSIVVLRHSYRYGAKSGIGRLARAIREGEAAAALAVLDDPAASDVARCDPTRDGGLDERFREEIVEVFGAAGPGRRASLERLDALDGFRVLAAHRKGPSGVEELNRQVEDWLRAAHRVGPGERIFEGRPLLVTRNDYSLSLYNGDVGLVVSDPDSPEHLVVAFRGRAGELRLLSAGRLPAHETAWAMTVHKSQGSEFDRVLVVLPERESPVVTRELLYTAVTRARERVVVQASARVVARAIASRTRRASGLRDLLWP